MQQGGGRVGHACQKVKFNQMRNREKRKVEKKKKWTYETVLLLISSTHQMANIILDDGHFAKEREKDGGGWRKGSCTLLYSGHGGKLQSSVTHLEYLTHCERHYFFLIKSFSGFWIAIAILTETAWDPASILGVKQEWRLCPFEGDDDESQTQSCFMKGESEKRWPIMCACREKTRGDHNSKTQVWSEVWVCVFSMCVATHVQNMHTWFK